MYIHVCMKIYVYVTGMYIFSHICVLYMYTYTNTNTHTHTHMYLYTHIYTHMYVQQYTFKHIYIFTYTCINTRVYTRNSRPRTPALSRFTSARGQHTRFKFIPSLQYIHRHPLPPTATAPAAIAAGVKKAGREGWGDGSVRSDAPVEQFALTRTHLQILAVQTPIHGQRHTARHLRRQHPFFNAGQLRVLRRASRRAPFADKSD